MLKQELLIEATYPHMKIEPVNDAHKVLERRRHMVKTHLLPALLPPQRQIKQEKSPVAVKSEMMSPNEMKKRSLMGKRKHLEDR